MCLAIGLLIAYILSLQSSESHSLKINPNENSAYTAIGPPIKMVAVLPETLTLSTHSKTVRIKTNRLGIGLTPALGLQINYTSLNKQLAMLQINSMKSSPDILAAVSRGKATIKVTATPPPKPIKKPQSAPAPVAPVPDYVAPAPQISQKSHAYTYCVAARGVDPSYLPELQAKLASVYSDSRGWSLGGVNSFSEVTSGCGLIVWLTAADQMPSFGSICDSMWSCTVYPNVILNFDRWRFASPAWLGGGGNLDDYRTMVINHETGHWLGFGHRFCSGSGQPAPVMQQQSISLQGCAANPWPLPYEKAAL